MNNKGQIGIGTLVVLAISIIVGLVLLTGSGGIAGQAGALTSTSNVINETFTMAANGAYADRVNCVNYEGTPIVINRTDGEVVGAGNYTFSTRVSPTTGMKVVTVKTNSARYGSTPVNASYTCLPQGYAEDSASRSVIPLITLFAALAIAAIALGAALKEKFW